MFAIRRWLFAIMTTVAFGIWSLIWLIFWASCHVSFNNTYRNKSDYLVFLGEVGDDEAEPDPIVVSQYGHQFTKSGSARLQRYRVLDTKPSDVNKDTGVVFGDPWETDEFVEISGIDVKFQIENRIYLLGYLQYNETTKTYTNKLDTSSYDAMTSLLLERIKELEKTVRHYSNLHEDTYERLFTERKDALDRESVFVGMVAKEMEKSNIQTGKFSGKTEKLEMEKIKQKIGGDDKQKKKMVEEIMDKIIASGMLKKGGS
jgi:hypothetical protein